MATDINLSLDDIIKKNKTNRSAGNNRRRNVGNRNNQSGRRLMNGKKNGAGGGKNLNGGGRFRNNIIGRPRPAARFSPYKRGDVDSTWSHDLFEDDFIGKRIPIDYDAGGTKIVITNLEFGVTDSDLEELFMEVGNLVSSEIHYDRSGRSLGSGSVVFEDREDAIRAIQQYDGIPLDGRPMKIEIASTAALGAGRLGPRRVGVFRNKNTIGGGGGGGGGGGRRRFDGNRNFGNRNRRNAASTLSAEQLDAELDEYRARVS